MLDASVRGCRNERVRASALLSRPRRLRGVLLRLLDATKIFVDNWAGFCAIVLGPAHPSRALERRLDRSRSSQTRALG